MRRSRSTAAWGSWTSCRSNASGATPASSGSGTARRRSSDTSSPGRCCVRSGPEGKHVNEIGTDYVRTLQEGAILEVTLDRPRANAIDLATSRVMGHVFAAFRDDPDLRVAILQTA